MLSGESTPLLKESIELLPAQASFDIHSPESKSNVLFGGTKVLQANGPDSTNPAPGNGLYAPDGGCLGYVLRTGFGTMQGRLVRTMVYSAERASANNWESLLFILFLMVFAIASAVNVWQTGLASGRKKGKLLLDCILIVTSVIPPELPMELSLAVNQSLIALSKLAIFCVEPFRIPFAGKLDILCFDKTGTLTAEKLEFEGVAGIRSKKEKLRKPKELPPETILAMSSCHSLMHLDSGVVGDPMEKALLDSVNWDVGKGDVVAPKDATSCGQVQTKIIKKYAFSSQLKRMATVCSVNISESFLSTNRKSSDDDRLIKLDPFNSLTSGKYLAAVKGAPEVRKIKLFR
jgi:cation-transporting ATPase 13A1